MSCTRSRFVTLLQSWVGVNESDGSHRKIVDIYNTIEPLPAGYRLKYTDAWCAAAVSAAAQVCNAADIIPTECSCPRMIEKARKMGIWVENDAHVPQPGDIILYDWQDSGLGDNTGSADHVGVVERTSGNTLTVIEGNYANAVKRRTLQVNGKYIRGYITPSFAEETGETGEPEFRLDLRFLKEGCEGEDVRALQILLKGNGCDCGRVDGIFGPRTGTAVRRYQDEKDLAADGIAGPDTMGSLLGV